MIIEKVLKGFYKVFRNNEIKFFFNIIKEFEVIYKENIFDRIRNKVKNIF